MINQTVRIIPEKNSKTSKRRIIFTKNTPLLVFAFFMVFALSFLIFKNLKKSIALSVSDFRAGNIISDYTMSNTSTMNESQIQEFLTKKNPCGDTNIWRANYYSGYKYHIENGKFVCLSQETFEYNGVKQTAAQVIYEAARDYRINPQVLLVLIEKEQGLVSDTWPNSIQYRSATGFGCPDTAECDSKYYGFRNQVRNAAKLFRDVLDGGYTNYPVGQNFIYYNPNFACGGSQVYIENLATSALYRYTPYQPNAAAVANYPGTSYCGAYGNRNFYALFIRWFGDPTSNVIKKVELSPIAKPGNNSSHDGSIENGDYEIKTSVDQSKYLDVRGANKNEDALVQLYRKWRDNNPAQKWDIESIGDEIYQIKSKLSGLNLSYDINEISDSPQLKLKSENLDDCSQRWSIQRNGNGEFNIITSCDVNHAVDVKGANNADETPVQIYKKSNNKAQTWSLEKVDAKETTQLIQNGIYNLNTALSNTQYLDVARGNVADYAKVQLFHKWRENNPAQQWEFKHLGNNEYQIVSKLSNKAISVNESRVLNGEQLFLLPSNLNSCSQKWKAVQHENGFIFKSVCNPALVMDVNASLAIDDNRVQLWGRWGDNNKAQVWTINKIQDVQENKPTGESQLIQNGIYNLNTALSNTQYLDVARGNVADYAKVQLFHKWRENNPAQQWEFKHLGNNEYQIVSKLSNKAISVNESRVLNGEQLFLLPSNLNSCSQKWKAVQHENGFIFKSVCNPALVMDVNASLAIDDNRVQLWGRWGDNNKAQVWTINRIY